MQTFLQWLVNERRQDLVPPEVLSRYEQGFREALRGLLQRVQDPVLRAKFSAMIDCPIKDANGHCRSFTDYIIAALTKHKIHRRADIEDALAYVYQSMMMDKKVTGEPKATVFGTFDTDRPYNPAGNPLEARFKTAIRRAVTNIASGRIARLATLANRPQGSISIGSGRARPGEMAGMISADELPGRPDTQKDVAELVADIKSLLTKKERGHGLPLTTMFDAMVAGEPSAEKRRQFGERSLKKGKQAIVQTIEDYARQSGNTYLMGLLSRIENPVETPTAKAAETEPEFSSLKEKDYRSILNVIDHFGGRPVGTADLGRFRRRWLEYAPRDPSTGHRNRLEEVLAQMLRDGVLRTIPGRAATAFVAGPNADEYRRSAAA